jgi:hypothetical protein
MKITSNKTIDFPKLGFSIEKGETKDAPEDKKAQEVILSNCHITEVKKVESKKNN